VLKIKLIAHLKSIQCCGLVNQNKLVTTSYNIMRFWNTQTFEMIKEIDNGTAYGHILSLYVDDRSNSPILWTATASFVQAINYNDGKVLTSLNFPTSSLTMANNMIWVNSLERPAIYVFDEKMDNDTKTILSTSEMIMHVQNIPSLNQIWCGSANGKVIIFDCSDYRVIKEKSDGHTRRISGFIETTNHVWSGAEDGLVCVWSKELELIKKIETHTGKIKYMNFHQGAVWCCTWNMSIVIYNADTFERLMELKDHTDAVSGVLFVDLTNNWNACSVSYDGSINIWKLPSSSMSLLSLSRNLSSSTGI